MLEGALQCRTTALRVAADGAHRASSNDEPQESSEFMKRSNRQVDESLVILFKIIEIGHEPRFSNRTALVVEMFYHSKSQAAS